MNSYYSWSHIVVLIILCLHIFCSQKVISQESKDRLSFQHLNKELSQTSVTEILEDSNGFLWFGTQNGVYKFNGTNFQLFEKTGDSLNGLTNSYIENIYEDENDSIYIGTTLGLNIYDRKLDIIKPYHFKNKAQALQTKFFTSIERHKDVLLLGTNNYGLYGYNTKTSKVIQFDIAQFKKGKGNQNHIVKVTAVDNERIIMITENAIHIIDENFEIISKHFESQIIRSAFKIDNNNYLIGLENGEVLNLTISKDNNLNIKRIPISLGYAILSMTQDKNGDFWLGTENNGLFIYSLSNANLTRLTADNQDRTSIKNNSIWSLYKAKNNVIWVGAFKKGISFYDPDYHKFKNIKNEPFNAKSLSHDIVNCFSEDKNGNLWIGTDGGGLNYWDRTQNSFEHYSLKNEKLNSDVILTILQEDENKLWLGSWNKGITIFNTKNKTYEVWNSENSFLLSNHVMDMQKDRKGRIWIVTFWGGIQLYNPQNRTHKTIDIPYNTKGFLPSKNSRKLHEDSSGNIWIGTQNSGVIKLSEKQNGDWSTAQYTNQLEKGNLSNNYINSITEDGKGNLLIATPTGLDIHNIATNSNKSITKKDGLISDDIKGVIEDDDGFLWLSTGNGIIKYNPSNGEMLNYALSDGLQGNEFNAGSHYKTKNNELIFGGSNGFNIFKTENIKKSDAKPKVFINSLKIFNKPVYANDDFKILDKHISQTDSLTLSYKQEVIDFEFNALLFGHPEKVQYAYFLEGFESDWNYVGNKKSATYTNLESGEYTLRIKSTNSDGVWNQRETTLHISITPPFWETWWFRLLALAFIAFCFYAYAHIKTKVIKNYQLTLEKKINERTTELRLQQKKLQEVADELTKKNEEVQRFAFAVTHDLKGPLSNIEGIANIIPSTNVMKDSPDLEKYLEMINVSCATMNTLIADITKIAKLGKIENDYEFLETRQIINLSRAFINNIIEASDVSLQIGEDLPKIYGDRNRFIQVFGNLLDNAVKYMGGQKNPLIVIDAKNIGNKIEISITDNGSGIDETELKKLFTPFERFHTKTSGSGLGLYMIKQIIESHNGTIHAESDGSGKGTTFFLLLPNGAEKLRNNETVKHSAL